MKNRHYTSNPANRPWAETIDFRHSAAQALGRRSTPTRRSGSPHQQARKLSLPGAQSSELNNEFFPARISRMIVL
jgi:hypothetical protein